MLGFVFTIALLGGLMFSYGGGIFSAFRSVKSLGSVNCLGLHICRVPDCHDRFI